MCGSTFSEILRGLRRQLVTGLERGWHGRWHQLRDNLASGYDEEAQIQDAINLSRAEVEFRQGVEGRGGTYERGGGGGSARLNPFQRMLRRAGSRRDTPVVVGDYNLAAGGRRGMTQTRINTGSWTQKGKNARESIEKAWFKFFHTAGVPRRQADSPYFVSRLERHRSGGEFSFMLCSRKAETCRYDLVMLANFSLITQPWSVECNDEKGYRWGVS
jgi:hypothetical protein